MSDKIDSLIFASLFLLQFIFAFAFNSISIIALNSEKGYYLVFLSIILLIFSAIRHIYKKTELLFTHHIFLFLLLLLLLIAKDIISNGSWEINYYNTHLLIVILSLFSLLLSAGRLKENISLIKSSYCITCALIFTWDFTVTHLLNRPDLGFIPNKNILSVAFAFCIALAIDNNLFRHRHATPIITTLTILLLAESILSQSYTGILFSGILIYLFFRRKFKTVLSKNVIILSVCLIIPVILALILNSTSLQGRILILKICLNNISEYWAMGIGNGNFNDRYPYWQLNYFENNTVNQNELLLADDSFTSYSSIFQFFVENGLVYTIAIIIVFYPIIRHFKTFITRKKRVSSFTVIALLSLLAFFPLESPPLLMLLSYYAYHTLHHYSKNKYSLSMRMPWPKLFCACVIILCALLMVNYARLFNSTNQWNKALTFINFDNDLADEYFDKANKHLSANRNFRLNYAGYLNASQRYSKCSEQLSPIPENEKNYSISFLLGRSYENTGAHKKAMTEFEKCSKFVPNRFLPKLKIAELYLRQHDTSSAVTTAEKALNIPIKVRNPVTLSIIRDLKTIAGLK